jgi:5-methylthioadenosine/S-adenosylhomocysteine deaminase
MADSRLLVRGGSVLTLDRDVGDFVRGDVLIEGSTIAAVASEIPATNSEVIDASGTIVAPGFVDTHRHTWQATVRGIAVDWTLAEYFHGMRGLLGLHFRPEDVHAANLLGRLEALDSGITTMLDWSHIMNSPQHADAAVQGLRDADARSIFAYGNANAEWANLPSDVPHSEDARRIRAEHFSSEDDLVTMAMALRGPQFTPPSVVEHDWRLARDLGLRITVHIGEGVGGGRTRPIGQLHDQGLLGADSTFIHCNTLQEDELQMMADSGATASVSPEVEMNMGHGMPATGRLLAHGIRPSLSVDVVTGIGGDMFTVMRMALAMERALVNDRAIRGGTSVDRLSLTSRDVLEFATVEGARACGLEGRIGTLTPGKQADLIVVRTDALNLTPLNNPIGALVLATHPSDVDTVVVAGRALKRQGKLLHADLDKVRARAIASRDFLLERAGLRPGLDWTLPFDARWQQSHL